MEIAALIMGILGNVASIMVYAAPCVTFYRIIKKRDTESFSPIPYVTCFISQSLWMYYGFIERNGLILAIVSAIGVMFETTYLTIFMIFADKTHKKHALKIIIPCMTSLLALFFGTFFGTKGDRRINIVGFLGAINSVCMYAAPLSIMKKVITTKSVEYMPFFLTFALFLNGTTWTTYALLIRDTFLAVPSGLGAFLGSCQLILYAIYYKSKPRDEEDVEKNTSKLAQVEQTMPMSNGQQYKKQVEIV